MKAFHASVLALLLVVAPASIGGATDMKPDCAKLVEKSAKACLVGGCTWEECKLPAFDFESVPVPQFPQSMTLDESALRKPEFFEWHGPWGKSPTDYLSTYKGRI